MKYTWTQLWVGLPYSEFSADSAGFSLDDPSCSPFAEQARGLAK